MQVGAKNARCRSEVEDLRLVMWAEGWASEF